MKRRKVIGLTLLITTVVYLFASFLALYQNQRVQMEKGIREALKVYSEKESQSVKELNNDLNILLEEKVDIDDLRKEQLNNEGSFARIEKNVTNVTNDMTTIGKNVSYITNEILSIEKEINNLKDKITQSDNYYNSLSQNIMDMNVSIKEEIKQNADAVAVIKEEIEIILNRIVELEKKQEEDNLNQESLIISLQEQLEQFEKRMLETEGNVLYYRFDSESGTLNIYGNKELQAENG